MRLFFLLAFTLGCTTAVSGSDAMSPPGPDVGAPVPEVLSPAVDASVDPPSLQETGAVDLPAESQSDVQSDAQIDAQIEARPETQSDAPADLPVGFAPGVPWPPPGTAYLTKVATEAEYNQLLGTGFSLPFIIRRLGNDHLYPYPWDRYECVFEPPGLHLSFLERMDPERALFLYYVEAKRPEGTLIPGQLRFDKTKTPNVMTVTIENVRNLMGPPAVFPLDPAVIPLIRERIKRCVPLGTNFTFSMFCPDGSRECPLQ